MIIVQFIKWKLIDMYRFFKRVYRREVSPLHLYGIYGFFGLPGKGKTMALTNQLYEYRQKYGDRVHIITNFNFEYQDEPFTHWKQLLKEYDKPLICAWDEVQNEFNSRDFKNFPVELLTLLTQNRKGHGKQILYTAQRWNRVDKVFRELTHQAVQCNTIMGRLTSLRYYFWEDYEDLNSKTDVSMKVRIKPVIRKRFIQTDILRSMYDSFKMLETAKSKDYMNREELSSIMGVAKYD